VLFALNDWTHLQSALDRVVTLDSAFRGPARWVFVTNFALAVLAGLGASRPGAADACELRPAVRLALGVAALLAAGALHAAAIAAVSGAVLLWTARRFAGLTPGAVLSVVSLDLAMFALPLVTSRSPAIRRPASARRIFPRSPAATT
jgi:hypothetical protein